MIGGFGDCGQIEPEDLVFRVAGSIPTEVLAKFQAEFQAKFLGQMAERVKAAVY